MACMSPKERHAHFHEQYAHGGREEPKPLKRGGAHGDSKWSKELGRTATHSKG